MVSGAVAVLTEAIEVLAAPGALPAVIHCSAGKDRTGVLSALILAFLGVPDETIVEDYALSAAAMGRLLERLKAEYPEAAERGRALRPGHPPRRPRDHGAVPGRRPGRVRHLRGTGRSARCGRGMDAWLATCSRLNRHPAVPDPIDRPHRPGAGTT